MRSIPLQVQWPDRRSVWSFSSFVFVYSLISFCFGFLNGEGSFRDYLLCKVISRRCFCTENKGFRLNIQVGILFEILIETDNIQGVEQLKGAPVKADDLRAGAAMVIAGMCAAGTTVVEDIHFIERGYENIVEKLAAVGADIQFIFIPDDEAQSQVG